MNMSFNFLLDTKRKLNFILFLQAVQFTVQKKSIPATTATTKSGSSNRMNEVEIKILSGQWFKTHTHAQRQQSENYQQRKRHPPCNLDTNTIQHGARMNNVCCTKMGKLLNRIQKQPETYCICWCTTQRAYKYDSFESESHESETNLS